MASRSSLENSLSSRLPKIALITVTYNSADVLPEFLASLDRQSSGNWTLVAVDNASSDATGALLSAWSGPLQVIGNDRNVGFAVASNQGIEWARANGFDAVMLLNNDTFFGSTFLEGIASFQRECAAPIVSPVINYADPSQGVWFADGGFNFGIGGFQAWMGNRLRKQKSWGVSFAPGCALLIAMDVFDKVGQLDERFFVYWEDADFCLRCRDAGIPIVVLSEPRIEHKVSALTGGSSPFSTRMYHKNQILFLQKHFRPLSVWLQIPGILLKIGLRRILLRDNQGITNLRIRTVLDTVRGRESA